MELNIVPARELKWMNCRYIKVCVIPTELFMVCWKWTNLNEEEHKLLKHSPLLHIQWRKLWQKMQSWICVDRSLSVLNIWTLQSSGFLVFRSPRRLFRACLPRWGILTARCMLQPSWGEGVSDDALRLVYTCDVPKSTSAFSSDHRCLTKPRCYATTGQHLLYAHCLSHAALMLQSSCWSPSFYILAPDSWLVYFTNFFTDVFRNVPVLMINIISRLMHSLKRERCTNVQCPCKSRHSRTATMIL